jgi:diguanylate cyclase (GGDEF)-like protein
MAGSSLENSPAPCEPSGDPLTEALAAVAIGVGVVTAGGAWVVCNAPLRRLAGPARLDPTAAAIAAGGRPSRDEYVVRDDRGRPWSVQWRPLPSGNWLVEALPHPEPETTAPGLPPLLADLDEATGVLSRGALVGRLGQWFANRTEKPFCLLFLDLDRFKAVNDRFGHVVGDRCLREVAQRLSSVVRGADVLGRYGGDEFLLLVAGVSSDEGLAPVRRRLERALAHPIEGPEGAISLGLSVGAAFSSGGFGDPEAMIHHADRAMYAMKGGGDHRGDGP